MIEYEKIIRLFSFCTSAVKSDRKYVTKISDIHIYLCKVLINVILITCYR